eukprot:7794560-Lingulodinium_polyedra.AAC.1
MSKEPARAILRAPFRRQRVLPSLVLFWAASSRLWAGPSHAAHAWRTRATPRPGELCQAPLRIPEVQ